MGVHMLGLVVAELPGRAVGRRALQRSPVADRSRERSGGRGTRCGHIRARHVHQPEQRVDRRAHKQDTCRDCLGAH